MEHQMKITMIAMKMIMITMMMQMTISMHGNRFHSSLRWHRTHQFIVSIFFNYFLFQIYQFENQFIIFKNSAAIENNCGSWSSITWGWNWIWLHGRSCSCPGWTKSITNLKIYQTQKNDFSNFFSIFFSDRMVHKRGMCRNAAQMAGINQFSAIVLLAIVGVFMKILAKIYRAHRSKMADRIVQ